MTAILSNDFEKHDRIYLEKLRLAASAILDLDAPATDAAAPEAGSHPVA